MAVTELKNPQAFPQNWERDGTTDNWETGMMLRDYFAAKAMHIVMSETQEMTIASFWDWVKHLLKTYLHFDFLFVNYRSVKGVYEEAAIRSYNYADAMLKQRQL